MKLRETLDSCIGKEIKSLSIRNQKIFPFEDQDMILTNQGTIGYYRVNTLDGKCVVIISIREDNDYNICDYSVAYNRNDSIKCIDINNGEYKLHFK
jgi:hypothetical protein